MGGVRGGGRGGGEEGTLIDFLILGQVFYARLDACLDLRVQDNCKVVNFGQCVAMLGRSLLPGRWPREGAGGRGGGGVYS